MERNKLSLFFLVLLSCIIYSNSGKAGTNPCGEKVPCDDGQCIGRDEWCDVFTECRDESDEKYCEKESWYTITTVDNKCDNTKHFVCDNKKCVPLVLKCDGIKDCEDNSDENNCDESAEPSKVSLDSAGNGLSAASSQPVDTHSTSPIPRLLTPSSTTSYYQNRMTENGNRPGENIYDQHRQNASLFNSGSDTIHVEDFPLSPSLPHTAVPSVTRDDEIPPPHSAYPLPPTRDHGIHRQPPPSPSRNHVIQHPSPVYTPPATTPPSVLQRVNRNYPFRHQDPVLPRPRAPYYSSVQYPRPVTNIKKLRAAPLPPFHFEQNNANSWNRYSRSVDKGLEWLMGQRDANFGWGKDTPRALVALSLISNSFLTNATENELMQRRLKLDLGVKLFRLRENSQKMTDSELAAYINALMATCQDPRSTFDTNLVETLFNQVNAKMLNRRSSLSPFSFITLCLANSSLTNEGFAFLNSTIQASITDEISKDKFILATSALACFAKVYRSQEIRDLINIAVTKLMQLQRPDGSFGTIYSTALATQALNAIYSGSWIDSRSETLRYMADKQHDNGSFGDMLATYYTLPALSGRSLVHLRNTQCDPPIAIKANSYIDDWWNHPGPKKDVVYTLTIENQSPVSLHLTVPVNRSFFDIMQLAQLSNSQFKFLYSEHFQKLDVHTINEIPNDPERGMYWNLYVLDRTNVTVDTRQIYTNDIRTLIPQDSQELLYWYLPYKLFPEDRYNNAPSPPPYLPYNALPSPASLIRVPPQPSYHIPPPPTYPPYSPVYSNRAPPPPPYPSYSPVYPNRTPPPPPYPNGSPAHFS